MSKETARDELLEKLLEEPAKRPSFNFWKFVFKNPIPASVAILGFGLIVFGIVFWLRDFVAYGNLPIGTDFGKNQIQIIETEEGQDSSSQIIIHLTGAVEKPGVYELESGARLNDLLSMAGGLSDKADRDWFNKNINLAQRVSDGTKIYIPFEGEVSDYSGVVAGTSSDITKVNINTASQEQLESLPKIGPVTAKKIIDYREEHGQFQKIEDLSLVSGISSKTVEAIRDLISTF